MKVRLLAWLFTLAAASGVFAADKKIVIVAGKPSHGAGEHEFRSGSLILQQCLANYPGLQVMVYSNGWPQDPQAFDGADAVMLYMDGGPGHPVVQGDHLKVMQALVDKGVGLGCYHYAVEVQTSNGGPQFLDWIGGYYEDRVSTNPHWEADFVSIPTHPITRGVKPFQISDEWYFNIHFRPNMKGVTPLLMAKPTDKTRLGESASPRGPYPHIVAASNHLETLSWAYERPDGGRGFGFTGGHSNKNWADPNFRKYVLNSLLWLAKMEVPANGVESTVNDEMITKNLDPKGARAGRGPGGPRGGAGNAAPGSAPAQAPTAPAGGGRGQPTAELIPATSRYQGFAAQVPTSTTSDAAQATPPSTNAQTGAARGNRGLRNNNQAPRPSGSTVAIEDAKKLQPAEGLQANLFASEPMLFNPTDMDIDYKGRVWVTEGVNYRVFQRWGTLRPEGDRIVYMEDTQGTGVADKVTTFWQGPEINAALGICVLGNKVIVSRSPDVFVITDTDGDGKGDKKELLFTGIGGVDHDHGVHAFIFGPDGKLYFNFGNEGKQLKRPDGSPVLDTEGVEVNATGKPFRQGMVFRCNMDGSELEVVGSNFRNDYEIAIDSFGTLWQSDNDDDGNRGVRIAYVMEHGNFGYTDEGNGEGWNRGWDRASRKGAKPEEKVFYEWHQFDPGVVPDLLHTGQGAPTGMAIYEGSLLPPQFRNQMVHADAGVRVVRSYPVGNSGAGYNATMTNILASSDDYYRPADVCIAPDGALFVADWFDGVVGGHNMTDNVLESIKGRIYRVSPVGNKPMVPKYDFKSAAGAVEALKSPNQSARYMAWTSLHEMQDKAENALKKMWADPNPRFRARALQLLARIKGSEEKYVKLAIKDNDPDIRITALRIARSVKLDVIPYVKMLVKDPSAQVRRECAIALRHNSSSEAAPLWAQLAQQYDGQDRWYLEALGIGEDKQDDAYFNAWLAKVGNQWDTPAGHEIVWRSRAKKAPSLLVKIINAKNTTPEEKSHFMRALDFMKGPEKEAALAELLGAN